MRRGPNPLGRQEDIGVVGGLTALAVDAASAPSQLPRLCASSACIIVQRPCIVRSCNDGLSGFGRAYLQFHFAGRLTRRAGAPQNLFHFPFRETNSCKTAKRILKLNETHEGAPTYGAPSSVSPRQKSKMKVFLSLCISHRLQNRLRPTRSSCAPRSPPCRRSAGTWPQPCRRPRRRETR